MSFINILQQDNSSNALLNLKCADIKVETINELPYTPGGGSFPVLPNNHIPVSTGVSSPIAKDSGFAIVTLSPGLTFIDMNPTNPGTLGIANNNNDLDIINGDGDINIINNSSTPQNLIISNQTLGDVFLQGQADIEIQGVGSLTMQETTNNSNVQVNTDSIFIGDNPNSNQILLNNSGITISAGTYGVNISSGFSDIITMDNGITITSNPSNALNLSSAQYCSLNETTDSHSLQMGPVEGVTLTASNSLPMTLTAPIMQMNINSSSGTSGQVLTADGSGNCKWSNTSPMTLLSSQTASNSTAISFNDLGTYSSYKLVFQNVILQNNSNNMGLQFSFDNGVTYSTTDYYASLDISDNLGNTANYSTNNTDVIVEVCAYALNSNSNIPINGEMTIYGINSASYPSISGASNQFTTSLTNVMWFNTFGGMCQTATNCNSFQMITGSLAGGNITSGTFKLYGLS